MILRPLFQWRPIGGGGCHREKYTGTKMGRPQFQKLLTVVCTGDTSIFDSV